MSLGQKIIDIIESRRDRQRKLQPGAIGHFWRDGGDRLLYDLPVTTGGLVIDAGGYKGEWSAEMIARFGCRSQIFEPVPSFAEHCNQLFKNNRSVQVFNAALGGTDRKTTFNMLDNGTSEYRGGDDTAVQHIEANVIDIVRVFDGLGGNRVACLKLNIEGGEYEVLERMAEASKLALCDSLLIQFHRQPEGYETSYRSVVTALSKSHIRVWSYEMVWDKWVCKES
jgi:FkbM family methyltransferase